MTETFTCPNGGHFELGVEIKNTNTRMLTIRPQHGREQTKLPLDLVGAMNYKLEYWWLRKGWVVLEQGYDFTGDYIVKIQNSSVISKNGDEPKPIKHYRFYQVISTEKSFIKSFRTLEEAETYAIRYSASCYIQGVDKKSRLRGAFIKSYLKNKKLLPDI
jgi:hypothetical protein